MRSADFVGQVCNLQRVCNPLGGLQRNRTARLETARRMKSCPTKQSQRRSRQESLARWT
jgi:hypothetical protein